MVLLSWATWSTSWGNAMSPGAPWSAKLTNTWSFGPDVITFHQQKRVIILDLTHLPFINKNTRSFEHDKITFYQQNLVIIPFSAIGLVLDFVQFVQFIWVGSKLSYFLLKFHLCVPSISYLKWQQMHTEIRSTQISLRQTDRQTERIGIIHSFTDFT